VWCLFAQIQQGDLLAIQQALAYERTVSGVSGVSGVSAFIGAISAL